jgi:hypothetical protein
MSKAKFTKLIIATLLGSLTMFIWGGFSHVVLLAGNPFSRGKLLLQLMSSVLSVLIAVQVVSLINAGYWTGVFTVTQIGLLTCSAVSSMYWNVCVVPISFFIAQVLDMVIGFFLAGLVICRILSKRDRKLTWFSTR